MEARNLILHLGNELDGSGRADAKVHVFSPVSTVIFSLCF